MAYSRERILALLAEGWELGWGPDGPWLEERLCQGGQTHRVNKISFQWMVAAGLLVALPPREGDATWLRRYGLPAAVPSSDGATSGDPPDGPAAMGSPEGMHFADLLAEAIKARGWTSTEFGVQTEASKQHVTDILKGRRTPPLARMEVWARALGLVEGTPAWDRFILEAELCHCPPGIRARLLAAQEAQRKAEAERDQVLAERRGQSRPETQA